MKLKNKLLITLWLKNHKDKYRNLSVKEFANKKINLNVNSLPQPLRTKLKNQENEIGNLKLPKIAITPIRRKLFLPKTNNSQILNLKISNLTSQR
jgi:hypothetical protein